MSNRSETEGNEVPGPSGTVRLEDLQETVQSLVQRALEANQSGTHPTTPPTGTAVSGEFQLLSHPGEVTRLPARGSLLMPTVRNVTTG